MKKHTLSIIHIILAVLAILISKGCTTSPNGAFNVHRPLVHDIDPTDYPLRGHDDILHNYGKSLGNIIFPRHNQRLTLYCAIHREWENVKSVYGKKEDGEYGYKHFITRNRRRNR